MGEWTIGLLCGAAPATVGTRARTGLVVARERFKRGRARRRRGLTAAEAGPEVAVAVLARATERKPGEPDQHRESDEEDGGVRGLSAQP